MFIESILLKDSLDILSFRENFSYSFDRIGLKLGEYLDREMVQHILFAVTVN